MDLDTSEKSLKLDITFEDYVATFNGLFNVAEMVGGIVLFAIMSMKSLDTKAESFLYGISYAYAFNGMQILLAGFLNHDSAVIVQQLFFYVSHQCIGTLSYVSGAMLLTSQADALSAAGIISMLIGSCHFFHFTHLFFKLYG
ncbi:uncharacterized protein [Dermacentor albipictus]|uniref:uncharacterized protein isoform X2 n=1 Tax=Dermacentor albipictus TaxID=60249 RepID=UPI0038FBE7D9